LLKDELACAGTPRKTVHNRRDHKTTPTCKNHQELHVFIVAELRILVHFGVLLFPRFTYGNYAATLANDFGASSGCMTRAEVRITGPKHAAMRHIHIMEKQGL